MHLPDGSIVLGLKPLDGVGSGDLVTVADSSLAPASTSNAEAGTGPMAHCKISIPITSGKENKLGSIHDDVKVHSVNTDGRVVLDTKINVLRDTETKVSRLGEVALAQLVLLDLQSTLENLLSLGAADGDVHGDLFVPTDAKSSHRVARLRVYGRLARELFQDLGGTGKPIARLADGNVENYNVKSIQCGCNSLGYPTHRASQCGAPA